MVRVISQETFDGVVKENEEDLGMSHEEAVEDAVKQFIAQGVDLSNIITSKNGQELSVVKIVKTLETFLNEKKEDKEEIIKILNELKGECDIDLAHKVQAGRNNAYHLLIDVLDKYEDDFDITHLTLTTITSLMTGQPDLLDEKGVGKIMKCLKHENDLLKQHTLRWMRQCCLLHEENRQLFMENEAGKEIHEIISSSTGCNSRGVIKHVCMVMRALVLDDDIRVPFGKAHDHARQLACDYGGLKTITTLLTKHKEDIDTVNELLSTLGSLVVREEFCREVEECGGLTVLMDVMITYPDDERLNRQCLKLLKGLAGSDHVKAQIVKAGMIPIIISCISRHQSSSQLFNTGALAVAAIALRSPDNSTLLCEHGIADVMIQGMKEHAANANIQKSCSLAIRNIVSRKRDLSKEFLLGGIEELLHEAINTHGSKCESNAKDALRDLGCEIKLAEIWTGKGEGIAKN